MKQRTSRLKNSPLKRSVTMNVIVEHRTWGSSLSWQFRGICCVVQRSLASCWCSIWLPWWLFLAWNTFFPPFVLIASWFQTILYWLYLPCVTWYTSTFNAGCHGDEIDRMRSLFLTTRPSTLPLRAQQTRWNLCSIALEPLRYREHWRNFKRTILITCYLLHLITFHTKGCFTSVNTFVNHVKCVLFVCLFCLQIEFKSLQPWTALFFLPPTFPPFRWTFSVL